MLIGDTTFAKINIVAAENFYGDIAKTLGGEHVVVTAILNSPQQDPHLFSVSPRVAKDVAHADIVIYNGGHYTDWMPRLLAVSGKNKHRQIIVVSDLVNIDANKNPHIWYDPDTMWIYAQKLAEMLVALDPPHKADYLARLSLLEKKQQSFKAYIAHARSVLQGKPIAATESVFNYMADALGLSMQVYAFQKSVEHDGAPSPSAMKEMLTAIEGRKISALICNQQVSGPMITYLRQIAQEHGVPVIAVTEMQPAGIDYYTWMQMQLKPFLQAN